MKQFTGRLLYHMYSAEVRQYIAPTRYLNLTEASEDKSNMVVGSVLNLAIGQSK
jgi:hypothetical protein